MSEISQILLKWYEANKRDLPWRTTDSPYKIWLSEIILQQTRVNQGLSYYNRFVNKFPEISDLALAPLDDVLKLWQGLGYYTRARNMHETANRILRDHGGEFPDTRDELLKLKGIGNYTAAAVASFAFGEPVALVDGNVFRVIARIFDNHTSINTAAGKKIFSQLASGILDNERPGLHNQAMMEFGALVCLPRNPKCDGCIFSAHCLARKRNTVALLPVKSYKSESTTRILNYLYIEGKKVTWIKKRTEKDIWHSLYEFPMVETREEETFEKLVLTDPWSRFLSGNHFTLTGKAVFRHKLSHQLLICRFFTIRSDARPGNIPGYLCIPRQDLTLFAVPRVIERFLDEWGTKRIHENMN